MTIKPSPFSIRAVSSAIVLAFRLTAAPAGAANLTLDLPEQALSRSLKPPSRSRDKSSYCMMPDNSAHCGHRLCTAAIPHRPPSDTAGGLRPDAGAAGQQLCYPPADSRSGNHFNPETGFRANWLTIRPRMSCLPLQYITAEIRQRNTGDGNVTELLRTNPAVQFAGNDSSSSTRAKSNHHGFPFTAHPVSRTPINSTASVLTATISTRKDTRVKPPPVWTAATRACI